MTTQRKHSQENLVEEARRIFNEGGKLRLKHLPVLTGVSRSRMELLLRDGSGPPYFQSGPGCVRLFDSVDVRNWILSKRKGAI
ncbi:hypothetical protein EGT07_08020 [Herbaspirillum sp. HC18]|nr:hypothetical protein EGT07_08020 [Herbaspirillum sp. HC18]